MKNVTYYNAGAGSGKTYKLTHLLAEKIADGINPSEVILTTFTNKAADDLRSRARGVLYEKKLHEQAALLDQAEIGTVHSLGEKFIGKFWYLLGLSPNMNVMDEEATNHYINRSLAELPHASDIDMFRRFRRDFDICRLEDNIPKPDHDYWKVWLKEVIDKATWYRVTDMKKSADESVERLRSLFKPNRKFNHKPEDYSGIFDAVRNKDVGNNTKAAIERIEKIKYYQNLRVWTFSDYAKVGSFLNGLPKGHAKQIENFDNIVAELLGIWQSQEVFGAIEKVIRRIFDIAQQWQIQYQAFKAEHRILDFNDMEHYFVKLLQNPACEKEIKGRYKLLMVDEFQDSSPVQVDIFNRLSGMVDQSYWCGDSKQAIYGFRGADTVLTEALVGMIEDDCIDNIKYLNTSYRSEPDIVEQCNNIFCRAFKNVLPVKRIKLEKHRKKESSGPSLIHWTSSYTDNKYLQAIVTRIERLSDEHDISLKDIAVLARTNYELDIVADAMQRAGMPVNYMTGDLNKQKEIELLKAILTLVVEPRNPLARAQIVWLTTRGFTLSAMVESRMAERKEYYRYQQELENSEKPEDVKRPITWLADDPLISKILKRRDKWQDQGVAALIESIFVELNLRAIMKSWGGSWQQREDNVYLLCSMADKYVNFCSTMAIGASINGFLNWLEDAQSGCTGNSEGVVLSTYHRAKGLQWKNVILLSLDNDPAKQSNIVKRGVLGIHEMRDMSPTRNNLFPEMTISMMPNIFTNNSSLPKDILSNIVSSSFYKKAEEKAIAESARLLYVGMTRACDRVITYARAKKKSSKDDNPMIAFTRLGIEVAFPSQDVLEADIFGTGLEVTINPQKGSDYECTDNLENEDNDFSLDDATQEYKDYDTTYINTEDEYAGRYVSQSNAKSKVLAIPEVAGRSGCRINLQGSPEMNRIGNCIHNTFAAFGKDVSRNVKITDSIVNAFGYDEVLPDRNAIVVAYEWLIKWLTEKYGKAIGIHHELPFIHAVDDQIVRGSIDLIWETPEGCVLIDFKTFPGKESDVTSQDGPHSAARYAAQFQLYRNAIEASGHKMLDSYVYYPIAGLLIHLTLNGMRISPIIKHD